MSMARGVAATIAGRGYLTILSLLLLPLYLQRLGAEAYGLVALFVTLQAWFQLLDMGLTATLAREAARFRAGVISAAELRQLMRALECVFLGALVIAGLALFLCADLIASRWLNLEGLSERQAARAIELMALCLVVRLLGELYRAILSGFERQVWLAGSGAVFGTLRLLGVLPLLDVFGASLAVFFGFQLVAGLLETLVLFTAGRRMVPAVPACATSFSLQPLRGVLGFSTAMALAGVVWVAASQFDKVLLSGILTLSDYGAFSLAVAGAAGVLLATGSLADTFVPRVTRLQAEGDRESVERLYHKASQWTAVIACTAAATLAAHPRAVLWVWTGNADLAEATAPVLALYALGNAAMAIAALPYYLQLAQGQLRLHLVGTGLMVMVLVPSLLWAAGRWGGVGAGAIWLGVNALYLLAWTPVAHRRFAPGVHQQWLSVDVAPVVLATAAVSLLTQALEWPSDRMAAAAQLVAVAALVVLAGVAASSSARRSVLRAHRRCA